MITGELAEEIIIRGGQRNVALSQVIVVDHIYVHAENALTNIPALDFLIPRKTWQYWMFS